MRQSRRDRCSPHLPDNRKGPLILVVLLIAGFGQEAASRRFEVHRSCYAGNTSMPLWAKENVKRCKKIFETTVGNNNILHETVRGGEYKFYHFTLDNFQEVNKPGGVKIRVEAAPCHGSVQLFVKPGLNFNGEPMNQMYETIPNASGARTSTWPFPDNNTGTYEQGPEAHMVEKGWEYPGPMFRLMKWGDKAKEYGLPNVITMKVLHGSYFISVLGTDFRDDPEMGNLHNNFTLSVSMVPDLDRDVAARQKERIKQRLNSLKTSSLGPAANGEYLNVEWETVSFPKKQYVSLANGKEDKSFYLDLHSFDEYQVYWATDSRTFYDFRKPNADGWGFCEFGQNLELQPDGSLKCQYPKVRGPQWPDGKDDESWPDNTWGPRRHDFLEKAPGFCFWPGPNLTGVNFTHNVSSSGEIMNLIHANDSWKVMPPDPTNVDCIMETECGVKQNGVAAYIKVKKNTAPEAVGLALKREICVDTKNEDGEMAGEDCRLSTDVPDPKAFEYVRYQMLVNHNGEGGDLDEECGRTEYVSDNSGTHNASNGALCGKADPISKVSFNGRINANYCDRNIRKLGKRCKPGLQCTRLAFGSDTFTCSHTYLTPYKDDPAKTEIFVRTKAPHNCWQTGEEYCEKGTKIINVPPIERRVKVEIVQNGRVTNPETDRISYDFTKPLRFRVPSIEAKGDDGLHSSAFGRDGIIKLKKIDGGHKLYGSLEEAYTAIFTAHGIASHVDGVSSADVLELQKRSTIEVTTAVSGVSADKGKYVIPMGPMPCSEPFVCTTDHWRSREVKVTVVRRECAEIGFDLRFGYKCTQFKQISEVYAGTKGNTTFDADTQAVSDNTILHIAIVVVVVLGVLVSMILFAKFRTAMRLSTAYHHVDKHLANQPPSLDERRAKSHLKERKKNEIVSKKQQELWKKKSLQIKKNIEKKKDEFSRRMKAIRRENQKRVHELKAKMHREKVERQALEKKKRLEEEARRKHEKAKAEAEYQQLLHSGKH